MHRQFGGWTLTSSPRCLQVSDSVLTIKGELPKKDDNGACARTLVEECCYPTKFHRSFKLPADVQLDKVS